MKWTLSSVSIYLTSMTLSIISPSNENCFCMILFIAVSTERFFVLYYCFVGSSLIIWTFVKICRNCFVLLPEIKFFWYLKFLCLYSSYFLTENYNIIMNPCKAMKILINFAYNQCFTVILTENIFNTYYIGLSAW